MSTPLTPLAMKSRRKLHKVGVSTLTTCLYRRGYQNVYLHGITAGSQPGTYVAKITFRSYQDPSQAPNYSDSCDDWTLDYTMIQSSGRWLIDSANAAPGVPEYQSCG